VGTASANKDAKRVNEMLGRLGLAQLDDAPGLCSQLGYLVQDHDHFRDLINVCEPENRRDMYESLRAYLHFKPHPLDVYIAQIRARAEALQLPTLAPDGSLQAFNVQDIKTDGPRHRHPDALLFEQYIPREPKTGELAIAQSAIDKAVANFHLHVVCGRCTKEATFPGVTKHEAVKRCREAGWTYDAIAEQEICPEHEG
jgi:hypothetical protein